MEFLKHHYQKNFHGHHHQQQHVQKFQYQEVNKYFFFFFFFFLILFNFILINILWFTLLATNDSRSSTPTSSRPSSRERGNYPQRAPSPTGSFTSTTSSQIPSSTRDRSNSNSSSVPLGGGWYEAVDPQSGRTYWFNRYFLFLFVNLFLNLLIHFYL